MALDRNVMIASVTLDQHEKGRRAVMEKVSELKKTLRDTLDRLEHRTGVLMRISGRQFEAGDFETARAYRKQAMESKLHLESMRSLLNDTI
jgi:hypothetical protein